MKRNISTLSKRILTLFLSVMMILSALPLMSVTADTDDTRVVDPETVDKWQALFGSSTNNTLNAGIVLRDKTVYNPSKLPADIAKHITMDENKKDNFLVSLSAIASNKEIKGYSNLPSDTMLVLDLSGSMVNQSNAIANMVTAANAAMDELFALNPYNRVGMVLYSGNSASDEPAYTSSATVLLPIDRYVPIKQTVRQENPDYDEHKKVPGSGRTNPYDTDGDYKYIDVEKNTYISRSNNTISIASGLKNTNGIAVSKKSKNASGGTYIQNGLSLAVKEFQKIEDTTIEGTGIQSGTIRLPIMVLMSDGAPTVATNTYTNIGTSNMGNGTSTSDGLGFLTQLTAAWSREQLKSHYGREPMFYTLGLGSSITGVAEGVLDPYVSTVGMNTYWNSYLKLAANGTMNVYHNNSSKSITRNTSITNQFYVNEYFKAQTGDDLINAFESIVNEIILQSRYYPTFISDTHNFDGYITFEDQIGPYMGISSVKGILIGDHFFSGAKIAQNYSEGGGSFGTTSNPTALGNEFIRSLRIRLGLTHSQAQALVEDAYKAGQLRYNAQTGKFSSYIGWYGDKDGNVLGHWHSGHTSADYPEGATTINCSYEFLGDTDETHGIADTDMMYVSVRAVSDIATGDQSMIWKIPAALIPVVTYSVSFEGTTYENGTNFKVDITDADPIQLLFEVELDPDIDEFNVTEIVGKDYYHINDDGSYSFYSNRWGSADHNDHHIDYTNPYSHLTTTSSFRPSLENERYYYTENTPVLVKNGNDYVIATGVLDPNKTYYHASRYFEITNSLTGAAEMKYNYEAISEHSLSLAKPSEDGRSWYIPKGTIYRMLEAYTEFGKKSSNLTETLEYSDYPFVENPHDENSDFTQYACISFLGNNGTFTLMPATGIKISKSVPMIIADTDTNFTFDVEVDGIADGSYRARKVDAAGNTVDTTVSFTNGKTSVVIGAGESLYIVDLPENAEFSVTERDHDNYGVSSSTLNGNAVNKDTVSGTLTAHRLQQVAYVNTYKTTGNLMINKTVRHNLGGDFTADLSSKEFTVKVTLTGSDIPETVETAAGTVLNVAQDGSFTFNIKDGQTVTVTDLDEGLGYIIEEINMPAGFNMSADSNGLRGTISADKNARAYLINNYEPAPYTPSFKLEANKVLKGRDWKASDQFIFQIQRLVGNEWVMVEDEIIVSGSNAVGDTVEFSHNSMPNLSFDKIGTYHYRIYEVTTTNTSADFERIPGIIYDNSIHSFAVHITDIDGDGKLEGKIVPVAPVTASGSGDNWTVSATFTNTYVPVGNDTFTLDINKSITGSDDIPLSGFNFGIYSDAAATELITTATTDANGKAVYSLTYSPMDLLDNNGSYAKEKTFTYYVKEIAPEDNDPSKIGGMTYNDTVYELVISLKDNLDGTIKATLVSTNAANNGNNIGTNKATLSIVNTYNPHDALVTFSGQKELKGIRDIVDGEFTFELYKTESNFVIDDEAKPVFTTTNNGRSFTFGTLSFDKADTHYYAIREVKGSRGGVKYDDTVYNITVNVTDNNDGLLIATYTAVKAGEESSGPVSAIVFENEYKAEKTSVTVSGSKTLSGRGMVSNEFTFELYDANDLTTPIATAANAENGYFSFTLEYDESDVGNHSYIVKEKFAGHKVNGVFFDDTEYAINVTVTDNENGKLISEATVTKNGQRASLSGLDFANKYEPTPTSEQFSGHKNYNGTLPAGEKFSFELRDSENNVIETVTAGKNEDFSFTAIEFTQKGVYTYTVNEVDTKLGGVKYDDTVYTVKVTVTDDGVGTLTSVAEYINSKVATGPVPASLNFTNTYSAKETSVQFEGIKNLDGRDTELEAGEFSFELYERESEDKNSNATKLETVSNAKNGTFKFSGITYYEDGADTYYYHVKEVNGGEKIDGVSHDDIIYYITVTVYDNGEGQMIADTVMTHSEQADPDVALGDTTLYFNNLYSTDDGELKLTGTKDILGRDMTANDIFEFELRESNENFDENGTVLQTVTNSGKTITFDTVKIESEGTKFFIVKEKNAGQRENGVTYDDTVYQIKVTADDNDSGELVLDTVINKKGDPTSVSSLDFVNVYTADKTSAQFKGTKTLKDRPLAIKNNEFTFELYNAVNGAVSGKYIQQVRNSGNSFEFKPIEYTETGVHTYIVKEYIPAANERFGVDYDTTEYLVTVNVTDNKEGRLEAGTTYQVLGKAGPVNGISFTNNYKASSVNVDLKGKKSLEGRELDLNEFTFELYETESDYKYDKNDLIDSQKNGDEGYFAFDTINYKTAGKRYYVVVENRTDNIKGGVDYDKTEYKIEVDIIDESTGQLKADITTNLGTHTTLNFNNTYSAKSAKYEIEGTKVLEKKALEASQFSFSLFEADANFKPVGDAIETVTHDSEGNFSFDELEFTEAKTYRYVVIEDTTDKLDDIHYDESVYKLKFEVIDDLNGQLNINKSITVGESAKNEIIFTNIYDPTMTEKSVSVDINIKKLLENRSQKAMGLDGFEFELKNTETNESTVVKTDKDGKAVFTLGFTEKDYASVYTYTLTEVDTKIADMTYSKESYDVTVKLYIDDNGKLAADVLKNNQAVENFEAEFTNVYAPVDPPHKAPQTGNRSNGHIAMLATLLFVSGGLFSISVKFRKTLES